MLIPWKVDVPQERLPFVNWLIIGGIIAAFACQSFSIGIRQLQLDGKIREYEDRPVEDVVRDFKVPDKHLREIEQAVQKTGTKTGESKDAAVKRQILAEYFVLGKVKSFILHGWNIIGLFGHVWLHGGIIHLLGNLLFLWIFGNAVCAKIGNARFFPVYLLLGLIAGISHLIFTGGDAIGASGAINGVVGMFLVFFPQNEITCYFLWLIPPLRKEFSVSSYLMILFWLAFDIWGMVQGGGQIAYSAHVGGFVGGFAIAVLMLKFGLVKMERYEKSLLQIIDEYRNPARNEPATQYDGYLGMLQKEIPQPAHAENPSANSAKPLPFKPKTISFEPPAPLVPVRDAERRRDTAYSESPGLYLGVDPPDMNQPKEGKASAGGEFIRFACSCGKNLKMPAKYAGKIGKCPKCNSRLKIPDK